MCLMNNKDGKNVCESVDEQFLINIINTSLIDVGSNQGYNFDRNPPLLQGQLGVPQIVDKLLGKILIKLFNTLVVKR